jgi:DNA-binding protein HU-beta
MTKKDFIEKYAAKTGVSKKAAGEYVEAFLETVEEAAVSHRGVQFVGFGTFEVKETAERIGRNPKTGEEISIPAKKVVKFKAGKKLQEAVN